MEPFDLAVGLGPVRAGSFVDHASLGERSGPEAGPVAGSVVGEASLDSDAAGREPVVSAVPELGGGGGLFVVEDLAVGDSGAVVDGGVEVAVADLGVHTRWRFAAAV